MTQYSRDYILDYGIKRGQTAGTVDKNLKKFGHSGLTMSEFEKISPAGNFFNDFKNDILDFGKGIMTAPGLIGKTVYEKGPSGLVEMAIDMPNAMLAPYNLSIKKIMEGKVNKWDVLQGIKERPANAIADAVSAGGLLKFGKGLPQAAATSKAAKWIDDLSPTANAIRKAIAPTKEEKLLNRKLARSGVSAEEKLKDLKLANEEFTVLFNKKGVNKEQVFNNLHSGLLIGNEATKLATKAGRKVGGLIENESIKMDALTPEELALNRQAQHVVYNNPMMDITHGEALDFINKMNKGGAKNINAVPDFAKKLVRSAQLADKNSQLVYIPQILEHNVGLSEGLGESVLGLLNKDRSRDYFSHVREIGNAAPEKISKNIANEFDFVFRQLKNANASSEALKFLRDTMGQDATYEKVKLLSENAKRNEVVVPKEYFNTRFKKDVLRKPGSQIIDELMNDRATIGKILRKPNTAKDYLILNKNDLKAVARSVSSVNPSGTLGKVISVFKTGVLGRPKWFSENRIDNWGNLIMSGVNPFVTIPLAIKYWKKLPKELDMTTAYKSLTGLETSSLDAATGLKLVGDKLMNSLRNKAPLDVLKELNSLTGMPIYRAEAICERFERANGLIHQTIKYAKANNTTIDNVLKMLETDKDLFWDLYKNVDDMLGDYTGRNYYLSNSFYKLVNLAMPFWKYPTQSLRLWGKQMYNNPILYQTLASGLSEMGREYNNELIEKYGLDPKEFSGGVLFKEPEHGLPLQTLKLLSPGSKFAAIPEMFDDIFSPSDKRLPLFPIVNPVNSLISFKNPFGKTPTMKGVMEYNGKLYTKDKKGHWVNYEPTMNDRLKLMARGLLDSNVHAAGFTRYSIMPTATAITNAVNKDKIVPLYTQYDTTVLPIGGYNPYSTPKTDPWEQAGSQLGVKVSNQYKPFKMKPSQLKKIKFKDKTRQRRVNNKLRRDAKR